MSKIDEIRKRHEATMFIDFDKGLFGWDEGFEPEAQPLSNSNARQCHADRAFLLERIEELNEALHQIASWVSAQAEDEGLFFIPETAPEAHLQKELRWLYSIVEQTQTQPSKPR